MTDVRLTPAFRHHVTGEVIVSPGVHDMSVLPGHGSGQVLPYKAGFVDQHGRFYNRMEAKQALLGDAPGHQALSAEEVNRIQSRMRKDELEAIYTPTPVGVFDTPYQNGYNAPLEVGDEGRLQKMIGYLLFPGLGVHNVPTEPHITDDPDYVDHRQEMFTGEEGAVDMKTKMNRTDNFIQSGGGFMWNVDKPYGETPKHERRMIGVAVPGWSKWGNPVHMVVRHEAQHSVFGRIAEKFGQENRRALATHLLKSLPLHLRYHTTQLGNRVHIDKLGDRAEETIAYMQNYLQDPEFRKSTHYRLGLDWHEANDMHDSLKRAWHVLRAKAKGIKSIHELYDYPY